MFDISLVPVTISTILAMVIGAVWYSPKVFGVAWMKETKISPESGDTDAMWRMVLAAAIQNFVTIYILAHFLLLADAYTGTSELVAGVWMSILVSATHLGAIIWEKKSLTYFSINTGYIVVVILISTLILTRWPWA